jgi:hypothetical protein
MRPPDRRLAWLRQRPYTALAVLALAILGVGFCTRKDSEWNEVFVRAADHLWHGQDIYQDGYLYPPFLAGACLPFCPLPAPLSRAAWFAVNVACTFALARWSWRLAGGPPLEAGSAPAQEHRAAVLGVLCGIPYIENCFAHMQTDVVMGAILVGGCLLLARGRDMLAASCLGVAAAIKCTPLLFAPYLLWRGRLRAALLLLVVAVGVNFLPDLIRPSRSGKPWLLDYAERYLLRLTQPDHYVGTWGSDPIYNQSLAGAAHRWLLTTLTWTEADCAPEPRKQLPGPLVVRVAAYGPALLLLGLAVWACGPPGRRYSEPRLEMECGVVILFMLLLSPMSSKAHFGVLVLPGLCLARAAARGNRLVRILLLTAVSLGFTSYKAPLGERWYSVSLWYGLVTWQTVTLLAGCLVALRWSRKDQVVTMTPDVSVPAAAA